MPPLTRWFIKTGLVYLVLSLIVGILVVAGPVAPALQPLATLSTLYIQLMMIGWITQLVFGIAYWMFPIYTRDDPRRSPSLGRLSYLLLNAGLILKICTDAFSALGGLVLPPWISGLAALLLLGAAFTFVVIIWYRVRGR